MATTEETTDRENLSIPSDLAIRQVFEIVERATIARPPCLPDTQFERRLSALEQKLMVNAIYPSVLMGVTALLALWLDSRMLLNIALVFAIIAELLVIGMMGSSIVGSTPFLWRLRKAPYAPFLTLVKMATEQDRPFVDQLSRCSKEALQYVLAQYKQGRNSFERRSGMLAGAIDKVGLFPALAGLVITISNLLKVADTGAWGSFFGPLLLIFYVQALAAAQMTQRMDRVIALLEFSIQTKK